LNNWCFSTEWNAVSNQ